MTSSLLHQLMNSRNPRTRQQARGYARHPHRAPAELQSAMKVIRRVQKDAAAAAAQAPAGAGAPTSAERNTATFSSVPEARRRVLRQAGRVPPT